MINLIKIIVLVLNMTLAVCVWAVEEGAPVPENSQKASCVLPLTLPGKAVLSDLLVPGERSWVDVVYLSSPGGKVIHEDSGEEIWWLQDQAILLLGSKSEPLPDRIAARPTVWVQVFFGEDELPGSPFECFPIKERIIVSKNTAKMQKSLRSALASVNATFLSQVVNYLAENLATLDVDASSYSIDNVPVINSNRQWVGEPIGGGANFALPYAGATSTASAAFSVTNSYPIPSSSGIETTAKGYALHTTGTPLRGLMIDDAYTGIQIASSLGDGMYIGNTGSPGSSNSSTKINGLEIAGSEDNGVYVGYSGESGVLVERSDGYGLEIQSSGSAGVRVTSSEGSGVNVVHADDTGVFVSTTGSDGMRIFMAGANSPVPVLSDENNGLEINAADDNGIYLGAINNNGILIESAGLDGSEDDGIRIKRVGALIGNGFLYNTTHCGIEINDAEGSGISIGYVGQYGVSVYSARKDGFSVANAGDDGLFIGKTGSGASSFNGSSENNGVEVASAEGYGLFVGSTGSDGIYVDTAEGRAAYFNGDVEIAGTCTGCATSVLSKNASDETLEPGDVVTIQGMEKTEFTNVPNVASVIKAVDQQSVFGVVVGSARIRENKESELELVPSDGNTPPGDYVNVVVFGQALVKANAHSKQIHPGDCLTVSTQSGFARVVESVEMNGKRFVETSAILGTAMEELEGSEDMIWVMVNPR